MKPLIISLLLFTVMPSFSQTKTYNGTWTKINTTYAFDFELVLKETDANQLEGYFIWKIIRYNENDISSKRYYESKIGLTAKEYVKGTYNPTESTYLLSGYKKEDPNAIIGIDTYKLKVDKNGNIGGTTSSNGSWLGRINAKQLVAEFL